MSYQAHGDCCHNGSYTRNLFLSPFSGLTRAGWRAVRSSPPGRGLPHLRWKVVGAVWRAIFDGGLSSPLVGPIPGSHPHILSHPAFAWHSSHLRLIRFCIRFAFLFLHSLRIPFPPHGICFAGPSPVPCLLLCTALSSPVHRLALSCKSPPPHSISSV